LGRGGLPVRPWARRGVANLPKPDPGPQDGAVPRSLVVRALAWLLGALALAPGAAGAQPFRGAGTSSPEAKDKTPTAARARALDKARRAALEAALAELGKLSKSARKSILGNTSAWTGSYRVLSERDAGDGVAIEVEVDIDLARLRKRAEGGSTTVAAPLFLLEGVDAGASCEPKTTLAARIEDELEVAGAVGSEGAALRVTVTCASLGPVPHTFEHAAHVAVVASSGGRTIASAELDGFAKSPQEALTVAVGEAAGKIGAALALHRRGRVLLRVAGGRPSVKLRRLERALLQSVMGVNAVELASLDERGVVVFSVLGVADAPALAQALSSLQSPGVQASVTAIEGPDVLAIELR